ncbi:phosphate regulon sensor histidine kinase PhoR [Alcaligenaceae bacterium CGII-47]|nr:phosphate regulon sensor histidine kinase PhoR [Alcaligenaceae bacterium CGII-47]
MSKTFVSVALWAFSGWLLGTWLGAATGWAVFAMGLLIMVLVSGRQLSRIVRWTQDIDKPPPPSVGPWDEILAPIYRKLKQNRIDLQERQRSLHRAILAAEALPDGAMTLDQDMTLQWCNQVAAEHLSLNLEMDRGHSILHIVRAPEFAHYTQQTSWDKPLLLHLKHLGRERLLQLHLAPYGAGQYLMVTRDVTLIERLENTRKDFVANVSHELRTPLTVLTGFLETLHDMPETALNTEQRQHYLTLMMEQADNMQALVADLLTLSALESSPSLDSQPVPMNELIQTALTQSQALSAGQHRFVAHIDAKLNISGCATELASAISNLLSNAVRYTAPGGTITVNWQRHADGRPRYWVQDTGIGIAKQNIPRLTERFFRVDRGRSRQTGGTGLGLAIAKHVAMRHQAELEITSEPGRGSTFTIVFPKNRLCEASAQQHAA